LRIVFTYDAAFKREVTLCAEKIGNCAAGRKCTVRHVYVIVKYKNKTVFMSDRKSFSGPKKSRNPEIDASVLEYLRDL
jgi:hypothetical protein